VSTMLKGMTWNHPRGLDSVIGSNTLLKQEMDVEVDWDARSLLAFGDQPVAEFYQEYDLMVIDHPHVPDAVHSGTVISFDELISATDLETLKRTSVGDSHLSYQYQGLQWALAIDTAAQVSAFRADKADRAPIFWSEVIELAKTGTLLWPHKPVDAFSTFATLMAQNGAPIASPNSFIDKKVAEEVLTLMIEISGLTPDFCLNSNPIDIAEVLSGDDRFTYGICMYGYSNYSRLGFRCKILTYDDLPSLDGRASGSQLGGAGIAVSSASKDPVLAARVALKLSSPDIQSTSYAQAGGQPANLAAWKSTHLNTLTNNFYSNTLRSLERAWVRPRIYGWPEVQYAASQIIHGILSSKKMISTDLDAIEDTYVQYIKETL
jgi:multiple sugar transport system substrate-binding protein